MKTYRCALEKINSYKPGKPIEEVKRALGLEEVYKLASNENPFVPFFIRKAINNELKNINRYPESGSFYLRQKLAKKLKVCPEQLVFGNGSDELIVLALKAYIEKGDEVVVSFPTFLIYEIQAKIAGAKILRVPAVNLAYDLEKIAKKVTKNTKIIFIANPDNPTGTYLNRCQVERFLAKIPKRVLVFFDEAYFEFVPGDFPQTLKILKKRGNIIVARTFSKAYGLAGLRIGYGVTTKEIAAVLNKIREPFNINRFAQVAAWELLNNQSFVRKTVSYVNQEKKYLYRELAKCDLSFIASATNFVVVNFKKNTESLNTYLLSKGVIIRELSGWGLPSYFRVTIGLKKENKKFIKHLKEYIGRSRQ
ncbi:MAG: histidinol-phosphate transaminase [Candidatus Omnitrophica bacterium]|nr:histidinol-phosphate transaminase [Candidatus Omnitrophota bacterium]